MLSLIMGFLEWLFRREERKLIIVGVDNAGKSTTLEQLRKEYTGKGMDLDKIPPTIGLNIGRFQVKGVIAICWDVGGQLGLRQLWTNYFEEVDGIIFVADSADKERFSESADALKTALTNSSLKGKPLLFLGNKQDKEDSASFEELSSAFQLDNCSDRPVKVIKCSARLNEGLAEGIEWIVAEAVKFNQLKQSLVNQ
jgi:ADP-ribosylation factor related protein 1